MKKSIGLLYGFAMMMAMSGDNMYNGDSNKSKHKEPYSPKSFEPTKCKQYLETDPIPKGLTRTWITFQFHGDNGIIYEKLCYIHHNKTSEHKKLSKEYKILNEFYMNNYYNHQILLDNNFIVKEITL